MTPYFVIMKPIRIVYLLLALFLVSSPGIAQGLLNTGSARGAGMLSGQLPENSRFSLEVGTGFSSFSSGTSMLGSYVSPRLEYDISPAFTIIAGGSFSFNQYNNLPVQSFVANTYAGPVQQGMTDHSLFVSGRYAINESLVMTGTIYREEGHLPMLLMNRGIMYQGTNQSVMEYQNHGMSMGFQYRVSDSFQFGAEVGVNRGNNPYSVHSPFSDPFNNRQHRSRHRHFPY